MTPQDALVYIHQLRQEYAARLSRGINAKVQGDWIPVNHRDYYHKRINALDTAIIAITLLEDKPVDNPGERA